MHCGSHAPCVAQARRPVHGRERRLLPHLLPAGAAPRRAVCKHERRAAAASQPVVRFRRSAAHTAHYPHTPCIGHAQRTTHTPTHTHRAPSLGAHWSADFACTVWCTGRPLVSPSFSRRCGRCTPWWTAWSSSTRRRPPSTDSSCAGTGMGLPRHVWVRGTVPGSRTALYCLCWLLAGCSPLSKPGSAAAVRPTRGCFARGLICSTCAA